MVNLVGFVIAIAKIGRQECLPHSWLDQPKLRLAKWQAWQVGESDAIFGKAKFSGEKQSAHKTRAFN